MNIIKNGIELIGTNKENLGVIYFDSGHLYIGKGKMPIVIRNISDQVIRQLGEFLKYYGTDPEHVANKIYFPTFSVRMDEMIMYIISDIVLEFAPISPSELKKVGIWFLKCLK